MTSVYPKQGEIYLIRAVRSAGNTKKRPAVVISPDIRNELSRTVLIVPFTSDLTSGEMPTRIYIPAGEGRLSNDSLALCEQITVVMKSYLEQPAFGQLTPPYLVEIQRGIQIAIGVY